MSEDSGLIVRQEMRQVLEVIQQKPEDGTPFLVSAWAAPAFRVYGGDLLKKDITWLPDLRISDIQVYEAWLRAGQPSRFWLVLLHDDFNRADQIFEQTSPYSEVKEVIRNGGSGACLLELRPGFVRGTRGGKK